VEQTELTGSFDLAPMKKDTQFTFRMPTDLKKELEGIAAGEGRSMAQICEAFLRAGSDCYKKEGAKILQRFLARNKQTTRLTSR
jgi:Arc-like DNA binding domain